MKLAMIIALFMLATFDARADDTSTLNAAKRIISDQISAFLDGDKARAFSHAAPLIRRTFITPDKFIAMVKRGYLPLFQPNVFRFTQSKLVGNTLYQELIVTGEKGGKWRAVYSLKLQEDGNWKIIGVVLKALAGDAI